MQLLKYIQPTAAANMAIVLLFIVVASFASLISGLRLPRSDEGPKLKILPGGETVRAPVNKPFVLNCLGDGGDLRLFTDLSWYNPKGEKIEPGRRSSDVSVALVTDGKLILTFMNPSLHDDGVYRCEGVFQNSERLTATISLNIYEGVVWKDCPEVQALVKGSTKDIIRCTASANPKADIIWLKDSAILDSQRYSTENNGVTIRGSSSDQDGGIFTVMASVMETGQLERKDITVEVHVRPEIVDLQDDYEVIEDEEASLTCHAVATPHAYYSWIDNNQRNLSEVFGYQVDRTNGNLVIRKVARSDAGYFKCIAENAAGRDEKQTSINIITKPTITEFENKTAPEGREADIVCRANGNPPPALSVRREGQGQTPLTGNQNRITLTEQKLNSATSSLTVRISDLHTDDAGLYYCVASNKAGSVERVGHLEVQYKPDLSNNPNIVKTWAGHPQKIICEANAIPNATIIWRDNQGSELRNDSTYTIFGGIGRSVLQANPNVGMNVYMEYKCEANNVYGRADHYISLMEAYAPGPVGRVEIVKKSPQSITFRLDDPISNGGLPILRYHVYYEETIYGASVLQGNKSWPAGQGPYSLDGLRPKTQYMFKFAAENEVGVGQFTGDLSEELPSESQPEPPIIIRDDPAKDALSGDISSHYSQHYLLRWSEPQNNGRPIESYHIKYYPVKRGERVNMWVEDGGQLMETIAAGQDLQYKLERLRPSRYYRIELSAKNSLGSSSPSYLVFKTAEFADGSVEYFDSQDTFPTPDVLISPSSLDLIFGILALCVVTTLIIIDLVLCLGYKKGLVYFIFARCCCVESAPHREENIKPSKESAV